MDAAEPIFASGAFLRLIERQGLAGTWGWVFATDEHVWSPGFVRLLGLEVGSVRPSHALFLSLVHPDDRNGLETAAQILQGDLLHERSFRVIHPDGTMRTLWGRSEFHLSPDGRPRAASGVVVDVTDRDRLLRAREIERRRSLALTEEARTLLFTRRTDGHTNNYPQFNALLEPPFEEIREDNLAVVVAEQRERTRARMLEAEARGLAYQGVCDLRMAGGGRETFRSLLVPVRDGRGGIVEWSGIIFPAALPDPIVTPALRHGLEQTLRGHHLRAARALLGWPMTALAQAAGLSLSSVRRLEEEAAPQGCRTRHKAVAALRKAGIRFVAMDDGQIAVARS